MEHLGRDDGCTELNCMSAASLRSSQPRHDSRTDVVGENGNDDMMDRLLEGS
jgi:hypothetical protein